MITVVSMTGLVTVQDFGRQGYRSIGVGPGGAMDRRSMARANRLVGNPPGAAVLEWALSGGSIEVADDATVAITGAELEFGGSCSMHAAVALRAGERLEIRRFVQGRFAYIAVGGGLEVPVVLGSRSTHLSAGFGGHRGRRLRAGDQLAVGKSWDSGLTHDSRVGSGIGTTSVIRVLDDPQHFPEASRENFWSAERTVSPASDRAGYRLTASRADPVGTGTMTSEPVCPGTIQLPPGGEPIVLMVEGPTVGGYPKMGVVTSVDLGVLAQKQPGDTVRFERITLDEAQRLARAEAVAAGSDSS